MTSKRVVLIQSGPEICSSETSPYAYFIRSLSDAFPNVSLPLRNVPRLMLIGSPGADAGDGLSDATSNSGRCVETPKSKTRVTISDRTIGPKVYPNSPPESGGDAAKASEPERLGWFHGVDVTRREPPQLFRLKR